jgi:hypothetical protein
LDLHRECGLSLGIAGGVGAVARTYRVSR